MESPHTAGLVVSIHDVCPGTWAVTEKMLRDLAAVGVERTSLLVIPNRHGQDPAFADAGFCQWLREKLAAGHELTLHGYYHQRVAQGRLWGPRRWVARYYTAGEGEFFDLSEEQARESLARGWQEMTAAVGQPPSGFIAPAWLLGEAARRVLSDFDLAFTTLISGVWDLSRRRFFSSQSLCYSVRASWRRWCSLGWNSLLAAWLEEWSLVRLALHPPDWQYPAIRRHALQSAAALLRTRPPTTYAAWLEQEAANF